MEENYGNKYIYLQAYIHQVGGHSSMLCLDDFTVCKPLIDRELKFYKNVPELISNFIPKFYGLIEVNVIKQDDYFTLIGYVPSFYQPKILNNDKHLTKLKLRKNGSIDIDNVMSLDGLFEDDSQKNALHVNPWVVKCHRDYLLSLATSIEAKNTPQNFLLLENLTSKFRRPCILDLKMGTRQYDDLDNLAKRQSKMVKVVTTTTGKLGVRIGGMQVYQVSTGRFLCRNKFYGRSLTTTGFANALHSFLHDGQRLRIELVPLFITKLEILAEKLTKLESLRLYTTSLLLLYEGQPIGQPPPVDRLRKNRESFTCNIPLGNDQWECYDYHPLDKSNSADSLNDLLLDSMMVSSENTRRNSRELYHQHRRSSSCSSRSPSHLSEPQIASCSSPTPTTTTLSPFDPLIDVRIIDFAHTAMSSDTGVQYTGPDQGFLFGLYNIISILNAINQEY